MRPIFLLLLAALEAASFAAGPNREQCLTTDAGVVGPVVAEECENLNPVACAAQERNVSDCAGLASLRGFCNEPRVAHHCCQECEEVDGERSGRMAEGVDKTREWKVRAGRLRPPSSLHPSPRALFPITRRLAASLSGW